MDKIEIKKRIDYINEKLITLNLAIKDYKIQTEHFEKYKSLKTVERDCEEIIESAIKINQDLLESTGKLGETYRDSFDKLVLLNLFKDKSFLEKLANTIGFRNRLAHEYIDLDEKITIKSASNILKLYPKYLIEILNFLDNN